MQEAMTTGMFLTLPNESPCVPVYGYNKEGTTWGHLVLVLLLSQSLEKRT